VLAQALPAAAKSKGEVAREARGAPPAQLPSSALLRRLRGLSSCREGGLDPRRGQATVRLRHPQHRHPSEHVYYGRDGKLRRAYLRSVVHGTAFAYRIVNGETQLVTNEHVASQPDVTDDEHAVEGVPTGSKKVREQLKIVRDETDDYEPGHAPARQGAVGHARRTSPSSRRASSSR